MSKGQLVVDVCVSKSDFDIGERARWLQQRASNSGALVTFSGLVRDWQEGGLSGLFIEHYPGMTESALLKMANQVGERWGVEAVSIVHRVGELALHEQIVFVGVAGRHRKEAFLCAQQLMDYLKRDAPFWKKELSATSSDWVEQKASDMEAADRW